MQPVHRMTNSSIRIAIVHSILERMTTKAIHVLINLSNFPKCN